MKIKTNRTYNDTPGILFLDVDNQDTLFFDFTIFEKTQLKVKTNINLQYPNDYDVKIKENGGVVILNQPYTGRITIERNLPIQRDDFTEDQSIDTKTLNQDQDYQTYIIEDLGKRIETLPGSELLDEFIRKDGTSLLPYPTGMMPATKEVVQQLEPVPTQGPRGIKGTRGPEGPIGPRGDTGDQGPKGVQGAFGPHGDTGPDGDQGPKGPDTNYKGSKDIQDILDIPNPGELDCYLADNTDYTASIPGRKGDLYVFDQSWKNEGKIRGPIGDTGLEGPEGDQGPQGDKGIKGIKGPEGPEGDQGPEGQEGDKGPRGEQGPQGPEGDQGPKGFNTAIPIDMIALWDIVANPIPDGWFLCNGTNGTPAISDYLVGTTSASLIGTKIGHHEDILAAHSHTATSTSSSSSTITFNAMPTHNHDGFPGVWLGGTNSATRYNEALMYEWNDRAPWWRRDASAARTPVWSNHAIKNPKVTTTTTTTTSVGNTGIDPTWSNMPASIRLVYIQFKGQ